MTDEPLRVKAKPTHYLRIEVPLNLAGMDDSPNRLLGDQAISKLRFDPVRDLIRIAMGASTAAYLDVICGDPEVRLDEAPGSLEPPWIR